MTSKADSRTFALGDSPTLDLRTATADIRPESAYSIEIFQVELSTNDE
jgi:hypothetical protein